MATFGVVAITVADIFAGKIYRIERDRDHARVDEVKEQLAIQVQAWAQEVLWQFTGSQFARL